MIAYHGSETGAAVDQKMIREKAECKLEKVLVEGTGQDHQ
jgi:hypothetical protein